MSAPNTPSLAAVRRLAPIITFVGLSLLAGFPVRGSQDCIDCHQQPSIAMIRDGNARSLFVNAEQIDASVHEGMSCDECHSGLDGSVLPHAEGPIKVDCLECHDTNTDVHQFHPAFDIEIELDDDTLAAHCADCHGSHAIEYASEIAFPGPPTDEARSCGFCHEHISIDYLHSTHAALRNNGLDAAPACMDCHSNLSHAALTGEDPLLTKNAIVALCTDCHTDTAAMPEIVADSLVPFVSAYAESIHGRALAAGNPDAPSCADCHESHGVLRHNAANSSVNQHQIATTCANCHSDEAKDYLHSSHAQALAAGIDDAPTCVSCHGEHAILAADDPDSPTAARNVSEKVCGDCHGSFKLAQRYNLDADRYDTFADSYHGLSTKGGATEIVNCSSCHGYHDVLSHNDPASLIHPDNIAQTCGQCHPDASTSFASGKIHVAINRASSEPVLYWIATLYIIAIILIVGGMFLHNLIDFVKKIRQKAHHHRNGPTSGHDVDPNKFYVRMTLNERLQHALLALSFIALAITGFMLRYPDAWWVEALRSLHPSLVETRGWVHRVAGVIMLFAGAWHAIYLAFTQRGRESLIAMLPRPGDFTDAIQLISYNLGIAKSHPRFQRFSYIEKLEYWALIWGSVIMTLSGFLLWFERFTLEHFTKLGFDIARSVHLYEAILATLAIIVWHLYWVVYNPKVYPMNLSWLTGKMSQAEMQSEHAAYLAELEGKDPNRPHCASPSPPSQPDTSAH